MKKYYVILLLMLVFASGCGDSDINTDNNYTNNQNASMPSNEMQKPQALDVEQFMNMYKEMNGIMIDVRSPQEIAEGKIVDEALEINYYDEDFNQQLEKLDKSKPYFLYCRSGGRSAKAREMMENMGFTQVYDLDGGISEM